MKNIILVEGKDDVDFINILSQNTNIQSFTLDKIGGSDQELLTKKLRSIQNDFQLNPIGKLGIILDLDDYTFESRLAFLNNCLQSVFQKSLSVTNKFEKNQIFGLEIEIACYFIEPNLDVLLRKISNLKSERADCLFQCLNNDEIKKKERDKAWTYYYMLWDVCNKKEREKRNENINFKYVSSKNAWDLKSDDLKELKLFLKQFKT